MGLISVSVFVAFCSVAALFVWKMGQDNLPPIVEGVFQPEFMDVAMTLKEAMESGREGGAAFAVYHEGEPIIDMWAGYADREAQRRWRNQTNTLAFDSTKGALAVLMAVMVNRGWINYSSPIGDYWPDFRASGKESVTLENLLSHQAGLPYLSTSISLRDLTSGKVDVSELLCGQEPFWEPGSRLGYHELTLGLILDRLIPKIDPHGRSTEEVFHEEIAEPFGIEFGMSLPQDQFSNTARLHQQSVLQRLWQYLTSSEYLKLLLSYMSGSESECYRAVAFLREYIMPVTVFNNPELREITLSSFSGTGTARGLAKLYSFLANDGYHGNKRLLSEEALSSLTTSIIKGFDPVSGHQMEYTMGLQVFKNTMGDSIFGHAGLGGQMTIADPKNHLSMAYLTNQLSIYKHGDDPRFKNLQSAVYKNLQRYIDRKRSMQT